MLRIAEYNKITGKKIELKELEKYGFNLIGGVYYKTIYEGRRGQDFELVIYNDRFIQGYSNGTDGSGEENYIDDTLYDLIKDGFVEKDNNNGM